MYLKIGKTPVKALFCGFIGQYHHLAHQKTSLLWRGYLQKNSVVFVNLRGFCIVTPLHD